MRAGPDTTDASFETASSGAVGPTSETSHDTIRPAVGLRSDQQTERTGQNVAARRAASRRTRSGGRRPVVKRRVRPMRGSAPSHRTHDTNHPRRLPTRHGDRSASSRTVRPSRPTRALQPDGRHLVELRHEADATSSAGRSPGVPMPGVASPAHIAETRWAGRACSDQGRSRSAYSIAVVTSGKPSTRRTTSPSCHSSVLPANRSNTIVPSSS
mgnify:CR=1 FL=1